MEPQVIAAIISGSIGAFAGISRALGNFNKKLDRKFDRIQKDVDELKNSVIHDYVILSLWALWVAGTQATVFPSTRALIVMKILILIL